MPPHPSERRIRTRSPLITVRRFRGPTADELFVHCQPTDGSLDAASQAAGAYEALLDVLGAEDIAPNFLVSDTVFLRRMREDLTAIRAARARVLGATEIRDGGPATTFIGQPPLSDAALEVSAIAVVPRSPDAWSARAVRGMTTCPCAACAPGVRARVVRIGDETHLYAGNVQGAGRDAFAQAAEMFRVAEGVLAEAGMTFGNVVRTWIHLRDIDRDYAALNQARRAFFARCGLEQRPASTGVQGTSPADAHDVSLSFYAVASPRPLDVTVMSTPTLNEAWSYGADFSRGLRLTQANQVTLYVSGTASIDEHGHTVHVGNLEAQVDRMLQNIESLLAARGATCGELVSGVTYLKHPTDAPVLRAMLQERGFAGFPNALVLAPLCRPELLCEMEAVAILPLGSAGV